MLFKRLCQYFDSKTRTWSRHNLRYCSNMFISKYVYRKSLEVPQLTQPSLKRNVQTKVTNNIYKVWCYVTNLCKLVDFI